MPRRLGLIAGFSVIALCLLMAGAGLRLLVQAAEMPAYHDPVKASKLRNASSPLSFDADLKTGSARWHKEMEALRTSKWPLYDRGRGLVTLSLCVLMAIAWFRLWDMRNLPKISTPRSSTSILLILGGIWLALIPAGVADFSEQLDREYFPSWGDTIAIPIGSGIILVLGSLPIILLLAWFLPLRRARLPANLWIWDRAHPRWSAVWTVLYGLLAALILASAIDSIRGHFLYIPPTLIGVYVALSLRAAHLSLKC